MASDQNQESEPNTSGDLRFGFGENWADYIEKHFSDERLEISQKHLLSFLKLETLKDKTFLDVGCGSGLHSLAAWRAGAKRVVSFDYDENSVATTNMLRKYSGNPENWIVLQGSVLDANFMSSLSIFDVVYSWGVLHHTGSMWEAVENAGKCLDENGVLYMALYSKDAYVSPPYEYWLGVKKKYNKANKLTKMWMAWRYAWRDSIRSNLIRFKNPLRHMSEYKKSRGMSYWHDVKDWLGGYPMEFAGNKETEEFCRNKLNLELINIKAGEGNTEFLFRPVNSRNYWDEVLSISEINQISGPFMHVKGNAWRADISGLKLGEAEQFMLYENDIPIGWPNTTLLSIETWGSGRYRIDDNILFFSSTDNTNPNDNKYGFRTDFALK